MSVLPIFLGKKVSKIIGDRLSKAALTAFKSGKESAMDFGQSVREQGFIKATKGRLDENFIRTAEAVSNFLDKCIDVYKSVLGREVDAVKGIVREQKEDKVLKRHTNQGKKLLQSSETLDQELEMLHRKIHGDVAAVYRDLSMLASQLENKIVELFEANLRVTRPSGEEEAIRDFDFFMSFQNNRRLTAINFLYELLCTSGPSFEYYSSNIENVSVSDPEILGLRQIQVGPEHNGKVKLIETINSIRRKINNWSGSDPKLLQIEPRGQSVFAGPDIQRLAEIPSSGNKAKSVTSHSLFDEKGKPLFGKMEEGREHAAAFAAHQRHVSDEENFKRLTAMKATRKRSRSRSTSSSRSSSSGSSRGNNRKKQSTIKNNGRSAAQAKQSQPPSPPPVNSRSRRQPAPAIARTPSGRGLGNGFTSGFGRGGPAAGGLTPSEKATLEEGEEVPYSSNSPYQEGR